MFIQDLPVISNIKIAENTFLIEVERAIDCDLKPGQFFNIQVVEGTYPLLRRPFSISDATENSIFFMYKVVGEGTKILSQKKSGDKLNVLGPLGNSFSHSYENKHFVLIGGGIGIAPFPFLIKNFDKNQDFSVLFGVRNKNEIHNYGIDQISYASDDGSVGFNGNAIKLLEEHIKKYKTSNIKIFACGPNPMLRALKNFAAQKNIECEVSMESAMACGFGICQGCPIQFNENETYKLICKDGPVFNISDIEI
ncbi:MAG: dihydroorotate dehydrogenase electron transfer subunit [Ignavibacteriales bacterium]|nr:dihydroorotate dehydrogenase electron transfer subunit [Ignavibacteriales bacterium]MCB9218887.1 dihydroorotate dehydrogenase electron transfer subunit [Ignavibacteriales bacterium]